jgi:hypothetical protein
MVIDLSAFLQTMDPTTDMIHTNFPVVFCAVVPPTNKKLTTLPIHPPDNVFSLEQEVHEFSYSTSCRRHYATSRKVAGSIPD